MRVETTGIILEGQCDIRTRKCSAKNIGVINIIWLNPGRQQTSVCSDCLEEKVRMGDWSLKHAKINSRADLAIYSKFGDLEVVIEVKKNINKEIESNPTIILRNLIAHSGIPEVNYFILFTKEKLYLWKNVLFQRIEKIKKVDYVINTNKLINLNNEKKITENKLEILCFDFFKSITKLKVKNKKIDHDFFIKSGLFKSIQNGSIEQELYL